MGMLQEKSFDDGITIRHAREDDNHEAVNLVTDVLGAYGIVPDFQRLEADVAAIGRAFEPSTVEIVAEKCGRIVGVAILSKLRERTALLSGIYVSPAVRRQGVGKRLMVCVVEAAAHAGYKRIILETRERFVEAIRLYETTGWRKGDDSPSGGGTEMTYFLELPVEKTSAAFSHP